MFTIDDTKTEDSGNSILDAVYNPFLIQDDYFISYDATKVDSKFLKELEYFRNKSCTITQVPESYLKV